MKSDGPDPDERRKALTEMTQVGQAMGGYDVAGWCLFCSFRGQPGEEMPHMQHEHPAQLASLIEERRRFLAERGL